MERKGFYHTAVLLLSLIPFLFMHSRCGPPAKPEDRIKKRLRACLPAEVGSWRVDQVDFFGRRELAAAGEPHALVLAHSSLELVAVARYAHDSGGDMGVRIYLMKNSPDAWGVLSLQDGSGLPLFLGQQGMAGDGKVRFWKGRYCVEVSSRPGDEAAPGDGVLKEMAKTIEGRIYETGEKPALLRRLPPGISESRATYFHAGRKIRSFPERFRQGGSLLGFSKQTDVLELSLTSAVTAVLIKYPSAEASQQVLRNLSTRYGTEGEGTGAVSFWTLEEGVPLAGLARGAYLVLICGERSPDDAVKRIQIFAERL